MVGTIVQTDKRYRQPQCTGICVERSARLGNLRLVEVRESIIIGVEGQPTVDSIYGSLWRRHLQGYDPQPAESEAI